MKEDDFNEWYKSSFDQLGEEPPADVWSNIQHGLDADFNHWYKSRFEQLREEPPAHVWESIQGELDVEEVWTRVDKRMVMLSRRAVIRRWSSGIAAALLIAAAGLWMRNDPAAVQPVAQKVSRNEHILAAGETVNAANGFFNKNTPVLNDKAPGPSAKDAGLGAIKMKNKNSAIAIASVGKQEQRTLRYSPDEGSNSSNGPGLTDSSLSFASATFTPSLEPSPVLELFVIENSFQNGLSSAFDPSVSFDSSIAAKVPRGFGIGAMAYYNNTWIMNSTTYAGLKTKALYRSRMSMAGSYGLNASYEFNSLWGMEASLLNSTQSQVYSFFDRAGEYKEKTNTLEYRQATVLIKKKRPMLCGGGYHGTMRTLSFGPTFRYLYSAFDETNGMVKDASHRYSKTDYGITVDYGYDIPIKKKIMLSTGVTAYAGVKNISKGRNVEPSHFNRTQNAAIGIRFGARYIFGR